MKTRLIAVLTLTMLVLSAASSLAARKNTVVEGVLGVDADGNSLLQGAAKMYYFAPGSDAGKKILSICRHGKICVVRGVINGNQIINAYFVKLEGEKTEGPEKHD